MIVKLEIILLILFKKCINCSITSGLGCYISFHTACLFQESRIHLPAGKSIVVRRTIIVSHANFEHLLHKKNDYCNNKHSCVRKISVWNSFCLPFVCNTIKTIWLETFFISSTLVPRDLFSKV